MVHGKKALILFSGGLDSLLAAKILEDQGIKVGLICFKSDFFNCPKAREGAMQISLPLQEIDISDEMRKLVKSPPSGYGKNLNPCIDCHALMAAQAGKIMDNDGYDILATGEVLGQRPFSQNAEALKKIEDLAGRELLRPLSARLLPETSYEKEGLVKRHKLLDISGRSRKKQMELAKKYGINNFPAPAGGCLLTDPVFGEKMLKLMEYHPEFGENDIEIMKQGRNIWAKFKSGQGKSEPALIIIGRDQAESEKLEKLAQKGDFMLQLKKLTGPTTLVRIFSEDPPKTPESREINIEFPDQLNINRFSLGNIENISALLETSAVLTGYYSPKIRGKKEKVSLKLI